MATAGLLMSDFIAPLAAAKIYRAEADVTLLR